ncbi:His Kinase A (phospho-acceptor) domain-containing protein [Terrimicrobium sacchariphilum]|uniref:histidine kinase n=2 Tax=Terrimicrobium sacchariphilum TaxID=690879 RepID=A0A146G842_TERSA|nr:His Kinase A (phospho-acceptor) domain-containing protein [Terrimicrobium sacchariphilum]
MPAAIDSCVVFPEAATTFMKSPIDPNIIPLDQKYRDEFLGVLAHELRNPLAPLRNGLEIIRRSQSDPKIVHEALEVMDRQLQQLSGLIDGLVEASNLRQGLVELKVETLNIGSIIEESVKSIGARLAEGGPKLIFTPLAEPLLVEGDPKRIRQILVNLIENAVKYTGRDGCIEVDAHGESGEVEISVKDDGIGIPQEKLGEIFELFSKADHSLERGQDGLGLGLSIVRGLVELHGGSVEAHSVGPGAGSQFIVRLPQATSGVDSPRISEKRRVLVVDDNRDCASSLAMMLGIMGFETETAADGVEALRTAAAYRPDAIFLDIAMPKLNGYDVCKVIREQAWGKDPVVIALTGWGQNDDIERSREAGFDHHLVKPIELASLEPIVREIKAVHSA